MNCSRPLSPLRSPPIRARRAEYSDIGFIILAIALERVADESLDRFCQREIFGPLGMVHTAYNPPAAWRAAIPPTADDRSFRKRIIQGEVQDENASVLGGVAGHAGLFATAEDLATFAHVLLQGGRPLVRPETLALFTRRETAPAGTSRALGWDTPSSPSQSGKYFSRQFLRTSGLYRHLACGSIPSASFPSLCSPTGPGPIAATKRSRTCAPHFTMPWWKRWRKRFEAASQQDAREPEPAHHRAAQPCFG